MDIGRISPNFNRTSSIQGAGTANPLIQRDSFTKSGASGSIDGTASITGLSPQLASGILFSGKKASDLIDPFNLKTEGFQAWSAASNPETGGYFAGLVKGTGSDQKSYLASFNPDGSVKWKAPFNAPVYYMVPDKNGGVLVRKWSKILSYDKHGDKSWDYELPGSNDSFNELPIAGPDNSIFYATGKEDKKSGEKKMSVVSVKDGKLQWSYDADNNINNRAGLTVTKQGNVLFTCEGLKKPDTLLKKLFSSGEKTRYLVCLNPDGTKKFEKEVTLIAYNSARPVEGSDGSIFYLSDNDGSLNAITPDGESKWTFEQENISHAPVIDGKGNIYITTGSTMVLHEPPESSIICIDEKTGEKKWEQKFERGIETEPILSGDSIFLKVTKTYEPGNEPGFIKMNEKGEVLDMLKKNGDDGDGFVYLDNNSVVTRTEEKYTLTPFGSLSSMSPEAQQELAGTKTGETGKIEVKEKSVVIGGVTLKRGKFSGIFGHWF